MKHLFSLVFALVVFSFWSQSQNLVNNADFSAGSLTGWGTASGTTLGSEGGSYFAILHGENGVLYQRVTGVEPGKTYECKMSFKNLLVKQTTGYGFALEKGSPLTLPVFTIGASYLMCVNVTLDSLISCRMGISPQVVENGKTGVRFEPFFYYPVGIPKQNNSAANFAQYRVGSENLYSRRFSAGLVLINPFVTDMVTEIPVTQIGETGKTYIDPENNNSEVQSVKLKAGESKILLIKPVNTSLNQKNTERGFSLSVYPVPASNEVTIDFGSDWIVGSEKADLLIYNTVGNKVSEMPVEQSVGKVAGSVYHLKTGLYFVTVPEWNASARMVVGR